MSETKTHTPGPWVRNKYGELFGANGKRIKVYDAGIAIVLADPDDEERANGTLIAAAPAMAEALKAITDCYGIGYTDPAKFVEHVHEFMMEGRAALALSRGEKPE